jgi:branched-chain amino acid transport system ATP-binding protein
MAGALLEVTGLSKRFGGFVALDGIDLSVAAGERVGLIGPNGSGKSTLVNCICGTLVNEAGSVRFDGETVDGLLTHERTHRGMARSFQLPRPFTTLTVADNLRVPLLYTVNARPGRPLRRAAAARRAGGQSEAPAARSYPSGDAQARARARHGRRAQAPDR